MEKVMKRIKQKMNNLENENLLLKTNNSLETFQSYDTEECVFEENCDSEENYSNNNNQREVPADILCKYIYNKVLNTHLLEEATEGVYMKHKKIKKIIEKSCNEIETYKELDATQCDKQYDNFLNRLLEKNNMKMKQKMMKMKINQSTELLKKMNDNNDVDEKYISFSNETEITDKNFNE
jgi:hypothetical protein